MNRKLILTVLVIGIFAEMHTYANGEEANDAEVIAKIDQAIKNPLGHFQNNKEYEDFVEQLELIKILPADKADQKEKFFKNFQKYNNRRLELERNIECRAKELEKEIHTSAISADCIRFYYNQKIKIEAALTDTNAQKERSLLENSEPCAAYVVDIDESDSYYDSYNDDYDY
ncbi:uncharacterized protein LOC116803988 [Drosophila mojavensis]|uniref:uncharacterized protein LOC116803988 n=1 Tax=Drosophila mojavensis TaxID=7230 RepID=UPI0013EE584E|nr:uncharacterized protein LOC116803988 [Drosophila mojavensis]